MKKKFLLMCGLLVVALLLSLNVGCGNEAEKAEEPKEAEKAEEPKEAEKAGLDPNEEILQLVGFSAGGGFDTIARFIGKHLSDELGVNVITENRTGAAGVIPVRDVLNAEPDDLILVHLHSSVHPIQQALYNAKINLEDLTYLGGIRKIGYVLVVNKDSGIEKVEDLKGKELVAGMPGAGHICEVAMKVFADAAGFNFKAIPYHGMSEVNAAMLSGEIDIALYGAIVYENNKDELNALAVFSDERLPFLPDIPTIGELGYEDIFLPIDLQGYAGPPGMDEETAEILKTAIQNVLKKDEVQEWAQKQCEVLKYIPPEEFKEATLNILDIAVEYKDILMSE